MNESEPDRIVLAFPAPLLARSACFAFGWARTKNQHGSAPGNGCRGPRV